MKRFILIPSVLAVLSSFGQTKSYTTSSTEFIFSFANMQVNGEKLNTPLRFSMFFHCGTDRHFDFTNNFGLYTGLGLRNVGFITKENDVTIKRRNYYLGVPVAFKVGDLANDKYLFAGAEAELALNYKEKVFSDEKLTSRFNEWFSDRTPTIMPSVFAGINFQSGFNMKFRYYLQDFLKSDFKKGGVYPYAQVNQSKVFYFSICWNIRNSTMKRPHLSKRSYSNKAA